MDMRWWTPPTFMYDTTVSFLEVANVAHMAAVRRFWQQLTTRGLPYVAVPPGDLSHTHDWLARFFFSPERCRTVQRLTCSLSNSADDQNLNNDLLLLAKMPQLLQRLTRVQALECCCSFKRPSVISVTPIVSAFASRLRHLTVVCAKRQYEVSDKVGDVFDLDTLSAMPVLTDLVLRTNFRATVAKIDQIRRTLRNVQSLSLTCFCSENCLTDRCLVRSVLGITSSTIQQALGPGLRSLRLRACYFAQPVLSNVIQALATRHTDEQTFPLRELSLRTCLRTHSDFIVRIDQVADVVKAHPLLERLTFCCYHLLRTESATETDLAAACSGVREHLELWPEGQLFAHRLPEENESSLALSAPFPPLSASLKSLTLRKTTPALFPCAHFQALLRIDLSGYGVTDEDVAALARSPCAKTTLTVIGLVALGGNQRLTPRALLPFTTPGDGETQGFALLKVKWAQLLPHATWNWEAFFTTIAQVSAEIDMEFCPSFLSRNSDLVNNLFTSSGRLVEPGSKIKHLRLYTRSWADRAEFSKLLGIPEPGDWRAPFDLLPKLKQISQGRMQLSNNVGP